jgi:ATP-dependent helicase HrpA
MKREELAINLHKDEIIEYVTNNQVVVVEAPTGSGKTTQIPQILFEAGLCNWGMIGVTQPRRIAAFGVSSRIAFEMKAELGRLVGYKIRFDDKTSAHTQIKIMTDGILLEELRSDPLLKKYSIIIVDEAHERSLNIDFILGLLKEITAERKDLKVVISSATINAKLFSDYFGKAPIISVKTKPYPIEVNYIPLPKKDDYDIMQDRIFEIIESLEKRKISGDILIFLPGEDSIKDCCRRLELYNTNNNFPLEILPLYARLAPEEQNRVFDEFKGKRKIVIATNIAETSITIDGVIHVIDSGYSKINYYNPRTFTSFLELKQISKASCDQRMGRAGRTAPGIVYRLYSEEEYKNREDYTKEEIYRTDLSEVVLRMADLGIYNYLDFDFISPPSKGAINSAIETLVSIEALDMGNRLTDLGKKMVDFPLAPRLSRILLEAATNCTSVTNSILIIISFLSAKSPFLYPAGEEIESRKAQKKLSSKGGDFFSWINLFFRYEKAKDKEKFAAEFYLDIRSLNEIMNIHDQLTSMMKDRGYSIGTDLDYDQIVICICTGLKQYICQKESKKKNTYHSVTEKDIRIHPGSYLYNDVPEWIVGGEIVNTGRTYIRTATMVTEKLIKSQFSDVYSLITKRRPLINKKTLREETTYVKTRSVEETRIMICDKYFDIIKEKNDKIVNVPYSVIIQLKDRKEKILKQDFGNFRAKLVYKDRIILKDKLKSLVQYFDKIDLDTGLNQHYPRNRFFSYPDDWIDIFRYASVILKPTIPASNAKKTGFLTLRFLGENNYEYYLEKDFFTAIEESLGAIEKLFDSEIPAWNETEKPVLEAIHHKLNKLSEEMEV